MQFLNAAVDVQALPRVESLTLKPVQREYLKVLRIEWMITTVALLAIAAALIWLIPSMTASYGWIIVAAAALVIIVMYRWLLEKNFPFLAYAVREKDVVSQRGWLTRTTKVAPYNRIQNCSVQSGPLERKYGLASLTIFTAGSDQADMKLVGLQQEEAEQLRHFILQQIHGEAHETT